MTEGRIITISPEGRESLTGALEEGTQGAAFLALKSNAPILPIAITGTYNRIVYRNLLRLRKTSVTLTIGKPIWLPNYRDREAAMQEGTTLIMKTIAAMLPPEYRGVYKAVEE